MQNLEEDGDLARMLAEQEAFLASKETPAAKVVRRQEEGSSDSGTCGGIDELNTHELEAGNILSMGCAGGLDQTQEGKSTLNDDLLSPIPPHHHHHAAAPPSHPQQQQPAPVAAAEPALPVLIGSVVEKTGEGMRREGGREGGREGRR